MKKALFFLAVLCVAGIFSAKAQSASDSAYARDLSYTYVNAGNLPFTVTDSLSDGGKILKDVRPGYRGKGYTINLTATKTIDIHLNCTSWGGTWDEFLLLLDSNYNLITYNDDYVTGGSRIIRNLTPGNYYIIAQEYSYYTSYTKSYTLSIDEINTTTLNALTYTPLGTITDTTVNDTFAASFPYVVFDNYAYNAKGYSFQGTQNSRIIIDDGSLGALFILMDNNYNILRQSYYSVNMQLPQTGTYYLAILDRETYACETRLRVLNSLPVYYIDGVNGDDARNGFTPSTALKTLDTAFARSGGVGKYYLTEDYTFSDSYITAHYAQIYPYQKDIRLNASTYSSYTALYVLGDLILGEQGGSHYLIIDSNQTSYNYGFMWGNSGSHIELNNVKVKDSYFQYSFIIYADEVVIRDCEFVNDSFDYYFIYKSYKLLNNVHFINTNFSQNYLGYYLVVDENQNSTTFTLENTNVTGNTFGDLHWLPNYSTVNLVSGSWRNNRIESDYEYNDNPNLTTQNCGGLWLWGVTANISDGFTMDVNNYICFDTASRLNIAENLNGNLVAQIYPYWYDYGDYKYKADYYEGRRVLWGTSSLLANNYQKFGVAQADNSALWYIHPDGTIHSWPVSIDQAEESTISLYPNPANNVLNIALQGTEVNEVVVIDIYGKTVARTTVANGNNTLDISALPAGMYFVQLRADSNVKVTQKIVKR